MARGEYKKYCELSKRQQADVRKRMKPPYVSYLYKISGGKVSHRIRRRLGDGRMVMRKGEKSKKTGRVEAYTFGEARRKPRWPFN